MNANEERDFIIEAVTNAKVPTVHPDAANTIDIGRAVLAAYRAKLATPAGSDTGIDLDLDKLEALARMATPGPWHWVENMDGDKMAELRSRSNALICDFGCDGKVPVEGTEPDEADMQFIASLDPSAILALIALARRAAPAQIGLDERAREEAAVDEKLVDQAVAVWTKSPPFASFAQQASTSAPTGNTPRVDALMAKWDDDGATRGSAFIELRDLARELEASTSAPGAPFPARDWSKPAEQQGLFRKFSVSRTDGSDVYGSKHFGCRYFVLDLTHDQYAPAAMRAYATSCRTTHPQLADDIEAEFGAAPAIGQAPTAEPDEDLFEEMVEAGYTALAEHSDAWRGDPEASPASGRESFAVALRAALIEQYKAAATPAEHSRSAIGTEASDA